MEQPVDSVDPFETAERRALAETVARFTAERIVPHLQEWEDAGELPQQLHRDAADVGLLGIGYPVEFGGSGGSVVDVTVMTEALLGAGGSGGLFASLFSLGIAVPHIIDAIRRRETAGDAGGAAWLDEKFVRPTLAGESIAALGVTEPDGGSDVARLRTRAERDGEDWIINGAKTYITSGVRADVVVIAARIGAPGASGISLFAVDTKTPGFNVARRLDKMGWQSSDTAELSLVDCRVPGVALLTPNAGEGFASLARHFATERLSLATLGYATAARCYDLTLTWTRQRETFGRALATRQVIRHDLVEMYRQIDVARSYTRQVAFKIAAGQDAVLQAVLAKNTAVAACEYVVDRAVQLFGGAGYMRGSEVERHYRDARILGIGGGATEVMTDLAAKLLAI